MKSVVALSAVALAASSASFGCDNREAFREPDLKLSRMLDQRRADPFEGTSAFDDGKVMRHPPGGTIATDDDTDAPMPPTTRELLQLGKSRFDTMCATCHGVTGNGESVVATKMELRPPPSIVDDENRERSREDLFRIVTQGYGLMASYADRLSRDERWAVVTYLKALQLSRHARATELPPAIQEQLAREAK